MSASYLLGVEPLNLGDDVRALAVELLSVEDREPARGAEAAGIWSRVLPALADSEPWALDFFSHLDRVREFCRSHSVAYRESPGGAIVIAAPEPEALPVLLARFERETFGARAGAPLAAGDEDLEKDLHHRGVDAYHHAFLRYLFCAVCDLESGFLTLLSNRLWTTEAVRRVRPALAGLSVEVQIPS